MAAWQLLFLYAFGCNMASYYGLVLLVEKHGSKKVEKHGSKNMARNMAVTMALCF